MAPKLPEWALFEKYVQKLLHLSSTISSGNKWYDPGDAASKGHHTEHDFPLIADCKSTSYGSYSVKKREFKDWLQKAGEEGKRFILPLRFLAGSDVLDLVVMSLGDFAELYEMATQREKQEAVVAARYRTALEEQAFKTLLEYGPKKEDDEYAYLRHLEAIVRLQGALPNPPKVKKV